MSQDLCSPSPSQSTRSRLAVPAALLWTASAIALVAYVHLAHARLAPAFEVVDVEMPWITVGALAAGACLAGATGLLIAAGLLAVTLLPVLRGARGRLLAKVYLGLALIALLAGAAAYWALDMQAGRLASLLGTAPAPLRR